MSPRRATRTQDCGRSEATTRRAAAKKFLETALLVQGESEEAYRSVAASLAVLAGIAASDAACCLALGRRSRGNDHHDAEALLETIMPGGSEAAATLHRLIDLKDTAQYGIVYISRENLKVAIKQAERLVAFADEVMTR